MQDAGRGGAGDGGEPRAGRGARRGPWPGGGRGWSWWRGGATSWSAWRRRSAPPGGEAHALAADVGDKETIHRLAGAAAALVGPVDLLVHNASTLGPMPLPLLLDTDCEDLERVLAVNLVGPFRLTKAVAGSMALRGGGLVLHVSSDAAA